MTIIKIEPHENGGHDNQTINGATPENFPIPEGYAIIPEDVGNPDTLENFPFGEVTWESCGNIPTVTSWRPLPVPEPEPVEPKYTELQLLGQQLTDLELLLLGGGDRNV